VVEKLKNWIRQTSPQAIALAQRAMAQRRDQTELLTEVQVMTLVMAGNEDALIPSLEAETMAQAIPNSLLEIFQAVGHLVPLEDPEKFQKSINKFLLH
jgi:pimeloyl-ACP methyl ester carboxylesterase